MRFVIGAYVGALAALVVFIGAGAALVIDAMGPSSSTEAAANRYGFDVASWELRHFPEKWLYKIGDFLHGNGQDGSDEDLLERYFNLTARIRSLGDARPESGELAALENERAYLENTVEEIIEGRITSILEDEGLTLEAPLFTDLGFVFPPVDFEFDAPPHVLATSPRDRIELVSDDLLKPGLTGETIAEIESGVEADGATSALVVQSGGVATYPSVVSNLRTYESLIELVSHEWVHQYLAFYPLGWSYFANAETRTLNESVANLAGRELARLYFEKYGELDPPSERLPTPAPNPPSNPGDSFDLTSEMRALRREVEGMLAEGEVEGAEALMAEKRDEFEENGVFIRRLNQAYFAFYGFYADTPASIDPIGPKLETLLQDTGSPGEFLRRAARITTQAELDDLLADGS